MNGHNLGGLFRTSALITAGLCLASTAWAATLESPNGQLQIQITPGSKSAVQIAVRVDGQWVPALSSAYAATSVVSAGIPDFTHACRIESTTPISNGLLLKGNCDVGLFEQQMTLTNEPDVVQVVTSFTANPGVDVRAVEDRYDFQPARRDANDPAGPLDFVWSQNIKSNFSDVIANWAFKSPVIMMQQGEVFAALMPILSDRYNDPLALDLDVTSNAHPWLSFGALATQPYGHSYFSRFSDGFPRIVKYGTAIGYPEGTVQFQYSIVASAQAYKSGYRRVVRRLWSDEGHHELMTSDDLQQNVLRPELVTFHDWATDTWGRFADTVYHSFPCGDRQCGTLSSDRNPSGLWNTHQPDAWFNTWFETLRSAYGWYIYGQRTNDNQIKARAESILNLAMTSPRQDGAFSTIYLVNDKKWLRSDAWAGFGDDFHALDMSWTAYWMLRWGSDLEPERNQEILAFVRPYGDFLVKHQLPGGVIPSWYNTQLQARTEFGEFNAETAGSALFLVALYRATGDQKYLDSAQKAMDFVTHDVLPRQRWFDFETYLSCARKPFSFYDKWTAQYPQNNLSQILAAQAYLELFQANHKQADFETGKRVLDYLLLTQQVWNNPALRPKVVGGFTTQNTDAEWSDARESYAAVLLWEYYKATGNGEYLERSVAAARSTFAVAPWENWAHVGFEDESGSLTGFHWGAGSGMTTIEMMMPALGDAFIDLKNQNGVGFNACSMHNLRIEKSAIAFELDAYPAQRSILVRFSGVDAHAKYRISVNQNPPVTIAGEILARDGYTVTV